MDILFLVGRIILGGFFIMMGLNHFMQTEMLAGYAGAKGVPSSRLAVLGTGVLLLIAGLSIITGFQPVIGVAAAVLFLVPVSLFIHNFWTVDDENMKMMEMTNFMKNMAITGAVLALLAIGTPWALSLG